MHKQPITKDQLAAYLAVPDLTEPSSEHAVHLLCQRVLANIKSVHDSSDLQVYRPNPIVSAQDNYDNLLIPQDNVSRSSTYTHYVDELTMLRTHTSANIPGVLRGLSRRSDWTDVVIAIPGLVYRRDVADKKHVGQIQMLDVWRVSKKKDRQGLVDADLMRAVEGIAATAAPGWRVRVEDSPHPYTDGGKEINVVHDDGRDIEVMECGLIKEQILRNAGLDPEQYSGWALGMGLDRLVMTIKDVPDIRHLRSRNPKIAGQMKDLEPYSPVSSQPAIERDMSYSVPREYVEEDISQDIMAALSDDVDALEEVEVLQEVAYGDLHHRAVARLGIASDQKNILVRVTLRHLDRSLTRREANMLYDKVYAEVNKGAGGYEA